MPSGHPLPVRSRKPLLTLVAIAPVLTEIVSGNTPPHALLHPAIALFLVAAYSLPLLVIREVRERWELPTLGVVALGLAYGILNEGLLAQTLLRAEHVPIANFDHYVVVGGVNLSWAALIVPWHALMAVLLPLTLLDYWFPEAARTRWLSREPFAVLAAVVIAAVTFVALARPPHVQMHAFLLAIAALVLCAWLTRHRRAADVRGEARRGRAFAFGAGAYVAVFLGTIVLATRRVATPVYFAAVAALWIAVAGLLHRRAFDRLPDAALVALGAYCAASVFNLLGGIGGHSPEAVACGAILATTFLVLWRMSPVAHRIPPAPTAPQHGGARHF